jgi:hypothetical protein
MSAPRAIGLSVLLRLTVASATVSAQTATGLATISVPVIHSGPAVEHDKELVATYDSAADSTHLAVVTHKGKYFLWIQRPRLTWTLSYAGRTPASEPPGEIVLIFRTQNPQSPLSDRLSLKSAPGERLEVASAGAQSVPGPMTGSLFMRFPIPIAPLAKALANERMKLSVGGIEVDFKPDQMEALRDLLSQAGAWPSASAADSISPGTQEQ